MRRARDVSDDLLTKPRPDELLLTSTISMGLPDGWTVLSGGADNPPPIEGLTSFLELADDEVVLTVLTRDYALSPDRLLTEITGHGGGSNERNTPTPDFRPHVNGRICCGGDGAEEFFVAALVMNGPHDSSPAGVGVEFVAAGPLGTVSERGPLLLSLVSTIGYR